MVPTLWLQQTGDVELLLGQSEGLLQVLQGSAALCPMQVHKVRPESTQDGQEHQATPPAGLEVFHTDGAANPIENSREQRTEGCEINERMNEPMTDGRERRKEGVKEGKKGGN